MKILSEISFQEMLRRWCIGEVTSQFSPLFPCEKEPTLLLLKSDDPSKQLSGINRQISTRLRYISDICSKYKIKKWFLASFPIVNDEFKKLSTIWSSHSDNTGRFYIAAENLIKHKYKDDRVDTIIGEFPKGSIELTGITFIANSENGPYTIIEGTARMVAIYRHRLDIANLSFIKNNSINIVLGLS